MPRKPKVRREADEAETDQLSAAATVVKSGRVAVQFFLDNDLTDKATPFIARQSEGMRLQLRQSHGWIDGWLDAASLDDARERYSAANKHSWPRVCPDEKYAFVDRHGSARPTPQLCLRIEDIREADAAVQPLLSVLFIRWGGLHRLGEGCEPADETEGGWGEYGSPPSDWYIDAIVKRGLLAHPTLGGAARSCEVASLFVSSDTDLRTIVVEAQQVAGLLRGRKACSWWMLWPADFPADWESDDYVGYVPRVPMFEGQRALERTNLVKSAFPHPADLWEYITGKTWMATLAPQAATMRLPACVIATREEVLRGAEAAARTAVRGLEELRRANSALPWLAATGGPASVNSAGLTKGVVKLGWSWEAKYVWFWRGEAQLARYLADAMLLPGCTAEGCVVQEWVDFDFELRLFFLPEQGWTPSSSAPLRPTHHEYTAWRNVGGEDAPGKFLKPTEAEALQWFMGDEAALAAAHTQAIAASQPLIAELLTKHPEAVPMIRMDWMVKRRGSGEAQVVFGEYCEMGACCLKWEAGPPKIWRAALDFALC
jgi:hypothetical protein